MKRITWKPNEDILVSVGYDDKINIYKHSEDAGDWEVFSSGSDHGSTVWAADFDSTGHRLVSCSADKTIRFYNDLNDLSKSVVATVDAEHERAIYDISWNKHNGLLATGCGDDLVRIIQEVRDEGTNTSVCSVLDVKSHKGDVNRVKWHPQVESLLLSCGDDGCVKLWNWITP